MRPRRGRPSRACLAPILIRKHDVVVFRCSRAADFVIARLCDRRRHRFDAGGGRRRFADRPASAGQRRRQRSSPPSLPARCEGPFRQFLAASRRRNQGLRVSMKIGSIQECRKGGRKGAFFFSLSLFFRSFFHLVQPFSQPLNLSSFSFAATSPPRSSSARPRDPSPSSSTRAPRSPTSPAPAAPRPATAARGTPRARASTPPPALQPSA